MFKVQNYQEIKGIDVQGEIQRLSFATHRENLLAEKLGTKSGKDMVFLTDEKRTLGTVNSRRPAQSHGEMMSWFTGQLDSLQVEYKLMNSVLNEANMDVYQEWVLNKDLVTPDGELMNSMFITRYSLISQPFSARTGNFRFICQNGNLVGIFTGDVQLRPNQLNGFAQVSINGQLNSALSRMDRVSEFYKELDEHRISDKSGRVLEAIFQPKFIPVAAKKKIITALEELGALTVTAPDLDLGDEKFLGMKLRKEHFESLSDNVEFHSTEVDPTLWTVYNVCTHHFSHFSTREQGKINGLNGATRAFMGALAVAKG